MKKIQPYQTLAGAMRALDNGGRFYNLFTQAGDQMVTAAELKKVAGVFGDQAAAALFLAIATSALQDSERRRILSALGPKARDIHQRHKPTQLIPVEFAAKAKPGKGYVVEGRVRKFKDEEEAGMIFVPISTGKVTTIVPVPTTTYYTVYELDGPSPGSECLVLTPKQTTNLRGRFRFCGLAKEAEVESKGRKTKRLRLQAKYYCEASKR